MISFLDELRQLHNRVYDHPDKVYDYVNLFAKYEFTACERGDAHRYPFIEWLDDNFVTSEEIEKFSNFCVRHLKYCGEQEALLGHPLLEGTGYRIGLYYLDKKLNVQATRVARHLYCFNKFKMYGGENSISRKERTWIRDFFDDVDKFLKLNDTTLKEILD